MRYLVMFALLFFCLPVVLTPAAAQTVLLSESFDSDWSTLNPPPGWRIAWTGDTWTNDWHRAEPSTEPWPANSTRYALLDSAGDETGADSLISPTIDCSASNTVTLRCSTSFSGLIAPYTAQLLGSTNGRVFNYLVYDYNGRNIQPTLQVLPLAWAAGQANVKLAWVTSLAGNNVSHWAIDNLSVVGINAVLDAACLGITSPTSDADSGIAIIPAAVIQNLGNTTLDIPTVMTIGGEYSDTRTATGLPPQATETLQFAPWTPSARGPLTVTCFTSLAGDNNAQNDTQHLATQVHVRNLAVISIETPSDTVPVGIPLHPQAKFTNLGEAAVGSFWGHFSISGWTDSVEVRSLAPDEARLVDFGEWTPAIPGPQVARCSLAWPEDRYPIDNTLARPVYVYSSTFRDVGAERIIAPSGTLAESTSVTPQVVIRSNSAMPVTGWARVGIVYNGSTVYDDSTSGTLAPGQSDTFALPPWSAFPNGYYYAFLRVRTDDDQNPANDSIAAEFDVQTPPHDVGVTRILAPLDTVYAGTVVPAARVRNYGGFTEAFATRCVIRRGGQVVHDDTVATLALPPGESTLVRFDAWLASAGSYSVRCSTILPDDTTATNDWRIGVFYVESLEIQPGWHEVDSVPYLPAGKDVKGGGALALFEPTRRIYALKGNKTTDFYAYDVAHDSWQTMTSIPLGEEEKEVGDGGTLCSDNNAYVYATKGKNTQGFYRYDVTAGSWLARAVVPLGLSNKKVKGGTSAVYVERPDAGYLYLLKGYLNEFYRYNTTSDSWNTLPPAPTLASEKYNKGSFIVYDGEATIYAHQAKFNRLFAFDLNIAQWRTTPTLTGMPLLNRLTGKSKKSKDGGAGSWYDGAIYAFKGGGTNDFWRYTAATDTWLELDTIPVYGSSLRKKPVKAGGAISGLGNGIFFALKGNKSHEFWAYRIPSLTDVREQVSPLIPRERARLSVFPNPSRGRLTVNLGGSHAGPVLLRVYDTGGRLMLERSSDLNTFALDCRDLAPGVYYLVALGPDRRETTMFIVE